MLAEASQWDELHDYVLQCPASAREVDDYGLLPLHWACTEADVPLSVVSVLLEAYPKGAETKNTGELLPVHVAIKANAPVELIQLVLMYYPMAVKMKTPGRHTALELAKMNHLPESVIELLADQEEEFSTGYGMHANRNTMSCTQVSSRYSASVNAFEKPLPCHTSMRLSTRTVVSLPPRWKNGKNCHICVAKFGTFRKRHHCRNCGESICRAHSAKNQISLPHFGLIGRQRVCVLCYTQLVNADNEELLPTNVRLSSCLEDDIEDNIEERPPVPTKPPSLRSMYQQLDNPVQKSLLALPAPVERSSFFAVSHEIKSIVHEKPHNMVDCKSQRSSLGTDTSDIDETCSFSESASSKGVEADTLLNLGISMYDRGSNSGAIAAFERAIELNPKNAMLYFHLGQALYKDDDLDGAADALATSFSLSRSAVTSTLLGKVLLEKGDHDQAIRAYQMSLSIQEESNLSVDCVY